MTMSTGWTGLLSPRQRAAPAVSTRRTPPYCAARPRLRTPQRPLPRHASSAGSGAGSSPEVALGRESRRGRTTGGAHPRRYRGRLSRGHHRSWSRRCVGIVAEHPDREPRGRISLADVDDWASADSAVAQTARRDEPQLAVRGGVCFAPRVVRTERLDDADLVDAGTWRLAALGNGTLDSRNVVLRSSAESHRTLESGEVRLAMRCTGVNFRDVLLALGDRRTTSAWKGPGSFSGSPTMCPGSPRVTA